MWTFLFKKLNKALLDLYSMCEIEKKVEYCDGVLATIENSVKDFTKLNHLINMEKRLDIFLIKERNEKK